MDLKEKMSPPWDRGLVLDGAGKTVDVFPSDAGKSRGDPGDSLFSMLTDSDAARLSEFCATAPAPSRDPAAFAANVAVFDLTGRCSGKAVAVKDRVFSGNHTVVYLTEGKSGSARLPDLIIEQFPEKIRPIVCVLNGDPSDPPRGFPLPDLAAEMKKRVGIDGTGALERLVRSVVRRLSAYPEIACGSVVQAGPVEPRALSASVCAGAFSAIFSLFVSVLNLTSNSHETTVRIVPRGDAAEVILTAKDPGPLSAVFADSRDLPSLAVRLPRCLEKLSLAAYLSAASGIAVDVAGGGTAGFSMTVFPDRTPEEFKDLYPSFDPDLIIGELAELNLE
ncbi:MAG: hypothetical protein IJK58_02740 [Clostridia bacterium]|nr:hypothetical protein [Clostridia bacterium]